MRDIVKDKIQIFFLALIIFTIIIIVLAVKGHAINEIGCAWYNYSAGIGRCWNEGQIARTTFYNVNTFQYANTNPERFNWAYYEIGIEYLEVDYPITILDLNFNFSSDFSTYYRINWSKQLTKMNKTFYYQLLYEQLRADDFVNMTMRVEGISGFSPNTTIGLYLKMKNISIGNNNVVDTISHFQGGTENSLLLNASPRNYTELATDRIQVYDTTLNSGIEYIFDLTFSRIELQANNPQRNVKFLKYVNISNNKKIEYSYFWIDAICNGYSSGGNCWFEGDLGATCDATCENQGGCKGTNWNDATCQVCGYFHPEVDTCLGVNKDYAPYYEYDEVLPICARRTTTPIFVVQYCGSSISSGNRLCVCNGIQDGTAPNVDLISPQNNTLYLNTTNTILFNCSGTEDLTNIDYFRFWNNFTGTWTYNTSYDIYFNGTYSLNRWANWTFNISINKTYAWGCQVFNSEGISNISSPNYFQIGWNYDDCLPSNGIINSHILCKDKILCLYQDYTINYPFNLSLVNSTFYYNLVDAQELYVKGNIYLDENSYIYQYAPFSLNSLYPMFFVFPYGITPDWLILLFTIAITCLIIGLNYKSFIYYLFSGTILIILGLICIIRGIIINVTKVTEHFYPEVCEGLISMTKNVYETYSLSTPFGIVSIILGLFILLALIIEERY